MLSSGTSGDRAVPRALAFATALAALPAQRGSSAIGGSGPVYGGSPGQSAVRWLWVLVALVAIAVIAWLIRALNDRRA